MARKGTEEVTTASLRLRPGMPEAALARGVRTP